MKTKKASLLTKLVVLALLIGAATGLLNLRQQILTAQSDLAEAEAQVCIWIAQADGVIDPFFQKLWNLFYSRCPTPWKTAMIPTGRPTSPAASWAW